MTALLTPQEAAARLHVSERTLRDLKRAGAIRYVAVTPRITAYREDDLAEYVADRTRFDQPQPAPARPKRRASAARPAQGNIVPFSQRRRS